MHCFTFFHNWLIVFFLLLGHCCCSYYSNIERQVTVCLRDPNWIPTGKSLEELHLWLINANKNKDNKNSSSWDEPQAFIVLSRQPGLKEVAKIFFKTSIDWRAPWISFASALKTVLRNKKCLKEEAKLNLLAWAVRVFKFTGFIKLLQAALQKDSGWFDVEKDDDDEEDELMLVGVGERRKVTSPKSVNWNGIVQAIYCVLAPQYFGHMKELFMDTWLEKRYNYQVMTRPIWPFTKPQIDGLYEVLGQNRMVNFLTKVIFTFQWDLKMNRSKEATTREILQTFMKEIQLLVEKYLSEDKLIKALITTCIYMSFAIDQHKPRYELIFAFIDAIPSGLIISLSDNISEIRSPALLLAYLNQVYHILPWASSSFTFFDDFRMNLCYQANYYCNPINNSIFTSLEGLRRYIETTAVSVTGLAKMKNPIYQELLFLQPLWASVIVTADTINDSLLGAPIIPITQALISMISHFFQRHYNINGGLPLFWSKIIIPRLNTDAIELVRDLVEGGGRGFVNKNGWRSQVLTMQSVEEWNYIFAPEMTTEN